MGTRTAITDEVLLKEFINQLQTHTKTFIEQR